MFRVAERSIPLFTLTTHLFGYKRRCNFTPNAYLLGFVHNRSRQRSHIIDHILGTFS